MKYFFRSIASSSYFSTDSYSYSRTSWVWNRRAGILPCLRIRVEGRQGRRAIGVVRVVEGRGYGEFPPLVVGVQGVEGHTVALCPAGQHEGIPFLAALQHGLIGALHLSGVAHKPERAAFQLRRGRAAGQGDIALRSASAEGFRGKYQPIYY